MSRILTFSTVTAVLYATALPALASDARSIALGGTAVANGHGVHGVMHNPASLMAMQRRGESTHLRAGFTTEIRDSDEMIDTFTDDDNTDLISDIESEIDVLSNRQITCNPFTDDDDTPCLTDTQSLSDLAGRTLELIETVDEESLSGLATADLGIAYTKLEVPFAVNLRISATGGGSPDVSDGDRDYISEFRDLLDENTLTLGEIENSSYIEVDQFGIPARVVQPEDILTSSGEGSALLRTQFSISMARTFAIAGYNVDFGVTPKFSSLTARSLNVNIRDEFLDDTPSYADRFEDSEVTESSFTADIGASMLLPQAPVQLALVIRNLIPESVETTDNVEFETTPQLIVGAAYQRGLVNFSGDIALNSAEQDSFESQKIGVGVEFASGIFAVRGGISHDAGRDQDNTSLSLGFALGPLELGGRLTGLESAEFGAQLAYSFQ